MQAYILLKPAGVVLNLKGLYFNMVRECLIVPTMQLCISSEAKVNALSCKGSKEHPLITLISLWDSQLVRRLNHWLNLDLVHSSGPGCSLPEFRSLGWCDKEETPILDGPMLCQTRRSIAHFLAFLSAIQDSCDEDSWDKLFSLSITCSPVCEYTNVYFWDAKRR